MKRWLWLLAVPYAIEISTQTIDYGLLSRNEKGKWECTKPQDACLDWAEALNEAHERRIHPSLTWEGDHFEGGK